MQAKSSPIAVVIDPPGVQSGMPGDILDLHVVVINQHEHQGAVIDVFFDEVSQTLHQWCRSPRERLALGSQQSSEVTFQFQIPFEALPGTYDYTLVIDAPDHFPEDTPIQYPRQFKVVSKEQTVVRVNDPTFSLNPTTNPRNPVILKPGEPLQVVVAVDNRSNRVDRFRLTCLDLEDHWFTIRYLTTGLEGPGLLSGSGGLELNPVKQGQILLEFHPPADTLAGSYSPTIRLHSANSPQLVLLDLVYIQVPSSYLLNTELNTILGKVGHSAGRYEIKLTNRGNTLRELAVRAKSRDEEELCSYQCEPNQARVLPHKSFAVNLTVKPLNWWRRPLIGAGLVLNFTVDLEDKQELPLTEKFPQGTLVWKPRPWWQFLLLVLIALGLLGGLVFIVWLFFFKPPPPLELVSFQPDSSTYTEGDRVRLNWAIRNPNQLSQLELSTKGPVPGTPLKYDFSRGIPDQLSKGISELPPPCQQQKDILTCTNINTDAKQPGQYTFELKAFSRQQSIAPAKTLSVEIKAKPAPEVMSFQVDKNQYTKGETMSLSWQVNYLDDLSRLKIIGKPDTGTGAEFANYEFSQNQIPAQLSEVDAETSQPPCKEVKQSLTCANVPVLAFQPGIYTFELQAFSKRGKPLNFKQTETKVEIQPKPFKIVSFTLNGSEAPNVVLQDGEPLTLNWKIEGEDLSVELSPYGNVDLSGSKQLTVNQALPPQIQLLVTDKFGNKVTKGFSVKVEAPAPSPNSSSQPLF